MADEGLSVQRALAARSAGCTNTDLAIACAYASGGLPMHPDTYRRALAAVEQWEAAEKAPTP